MESSQNNLIASSVDVKGIRPEKFDVYFRQQPVDSIAIFFKSTTLNHADLDKKFRDMLVRANQIAHLRKLVNIGEIREL